MAKRNQDVPVSTVRFVALHVEELADLDARSVTDHPTLLPGVPERCAVGTSVPESLTCLNPTLTDWIHTAFL